MISKRNSLELHSNLPPSNMKPLNKNILIGLNILDKKHRFSQNSINKNQIIKGTVINKLVTLNKESNLGKYSLKGQGLNSSSSSQIQHKQSNLISRKITFKTEFGEQHHSSRNFYPNFLSSNSIRSYNSKNYWVQQLNNINNIYKCPNLSLYEKLQFKRIMFPNSEVQIN